MERGYGVVATCHNLDDEAAVLLGNVLRWDTVYLCRQHPVLPAAPGFVKKVKPLVRLGERETAAYCVLQGIDYQVEECPMAAGNRHLGYKEVLNALEDRSPGSKAAFLFGFIERGHERFAGDAEGERDDLGECRVCGAPTPGDVCAFCRLRSQVGAIQAQTQAKLAEHRNEVSAQLRSLAPAPAPTNLPPAVSAQIAQIHKQFVGQFQAEANKTIADYNATKTDLDRQFAALHGADVGATGAAAKELDSLQKRRADLYRQIVAQVQRDAARIAKESGFAVVFVNVRAAAGGYDMTNQVIKDVESQHE